jgi:phage tail-like protein
MTCLRKIGGTFMKKSVVIAAIISCWILMPTSTLYAKDEKVPIPGKWQCALFVGDQLFGYFTECSGIGSESEVIEHRVVDNNGNEVIRKIPGRPHFGNIILKRGITSDMGSWDWRQLVIDGDMAGARKDVTIVMFNRDYVEIARWQFFNAWPLKVTGPEPNADGNGVGVEELTIVHEGMYREI